MRDIPLLIAILSILVVSGLALIVLLVNDSEPSLSNDQQVATSSPATSTQTVNLYYYRPQNDMNDQGVLQCSDEGLVAVPREVPISEATVSSVIQLLLDGELRQSERQSGITTEFPLPTVHLVGIRVDSSGVAVIALDDPADRTGGGSCRANVLRAQVEQTALQFSSVSSVRFLPDSLFQP